MNVLFEKGFVVSTLLLSLRVGALFMLSPLLAVAQVPVRARVLFVVGLAALLVMVCGSAPKTESLTMGELAERGISELIVGMLLAFGLSAAFAAFQLGGRVLDFQMGYSVANLIDPVTHAATPLIGTILSFMAVISFYMLDGHHMVIRGLLFSLDRIPLGEPLASMPIISVVEQFGVMFTYGLALVAPVLFALLLLDVGMALAARTMPQLNMFVVGIPIKILVGLTILAVSLNHLGPILERIYGSIFQYWGKLG